MTSAKYEEKKSCIISNGMDLMWDLGYNGTSVNDIVKAADVPKGSFYFYFKSKEDFAIQALREYFKESYAEFCKILFEDKGSPLERIKHFYKIRIEMLLQQMDDHQTLKEQSSIRTRERLQHLPVMESSDEREGGCLIPQRHLRESTEHD